MGLFGRAGAGVVIFRIRAGWGDRGTLSAASKARAEWSTDGDAFAVLTARWKG